MPLGIILGKTIEYFEIYTKCNSHNTSNSSNTSTTLYFGSLKPFYGDPLQAIKPSKIGVK